MIQKQSNDINFFDFLLNLWEAKLQILIITILSSILGIVYILNTPNSYKVSTSLKNGMQSAFINYMSINEVLKEHDLLYSKKNLNGYLINSNSIFSMFVNEFNDYEEMIEVLNNNDFVKSSIKGLSEDNKNKALVNYAKSFLIKVVEDEDNVLNRSANVFFEWHDSDEGLYILNEAFKLTLINIKNVLINDVEKLAKLIDVNVKRELYEINTQLNLLEQKQDLENTKRILYLEEHSNIAKELGVATNLLNTNALILSQEKGSKVLLPSDAIIEKNTKFIEFNNSQATEFPYYLFGYRAIDKEISVINSRSKKEKLLMANGYVRLRNQLLSLENDVSSTQLRDTLKDIETDNPKDWINFNFALADIKQQKKPDLIIALSILLGVILGILYVFILKTIRDTRSI